MAHVGVLLSRDILGLDAPQTAPEKKVRIAPHTLGLKFAKGTVNTPDGVVSVNWNTDGKSFELNASAPAAYALDVVLPEEIRGYGEIYVNGKKLSGKKTVLPGLSSPVCVKAVK